MVFETAHILSEGSILIVFIQMMRLNLVLRLRNCFSENS